MKPTLTRIRPSGGPICPFRTLWRGSIVRPPFIWGALGRPYVRLGYARFAISPHIRRYCCSFHFHVLRLALFFGLPWGVSFSMALYKTQKMHVAYLLRFENPRYCRGYAVGRPLASRYALFKILGPTIWALPTKWRRARIRPNLRGPARSCVEFHPFPPLPRWALLEPSSLWGII